MNFYALNLLPWVLGALLLVALTAVWARRRRQAALRHLTNIDGRSALVSNASTFRRRILHASMIIALLLATGAILRPIGGMLLTEHRLPAKNIILLIDVSKSMGVNDSDGFTRLEAAKLFAREFVARRPADRIGLISFAGTAFPECPTTLDRSMLRQRIDVQEPGGLPSGGTDLSAALAEATRLLTETPPPGSSIVLLSDGDNLTGKPLEDASLLAEHGIPIFTVAFGDPTLESPVPKSRATSRPNYDILREIAEITSAIPLEGQTTSLDHTLAALNSRMDAITINGTSITEELSSRPLELYAYPLAIAVFFLFLRFFLPARTRKWHPLTSLILFSLLLPDSTFAQESVSPPLAEALAEARETDRPVLLIFTGSDWSETSITFEREIMSQSIYKEWVRRSVVELRVDLPRANIDDDVRRERRRLAYHFDVNSFPTALFLDTDENELGRLTHDTAGPASWLRRADAILAGDYTASDSVASIDRLPEHVRERLEDPDITPAERSTRLYNHGIELEQQAPALVIFSRDRFQLLEELHTSAAIEAPDDRPDLAFAPNYKLALLHHLRGRPFIQPKPKKALEIFESSYRYYREAAALNPDHPELPGNLALLNQDRTRARQIIAFQEAYKAAVETTSAAYQQETRFRRSLDQWVTTVEPVNNDTIASSTDAIADLVEKATTIEFPGVQAFNDAREDILLAPDPHGDRELHPSTSHIKDALDHLLQVAQPQQGKGEGEGDDESDGENGQGDRDDSDGKGKDGDESEHFSDHDSDLRQSESKGGELRGRLLDRLRRNAKPVPPALDR